MGLLCSYCVLKAGYIRELALVAVSTSWAFSETVRPFLLHIKPEAERTRWNISWVIEVNLYIGPHLGFDAFDENSVVPRMLRLPLLELSGFG